MKKKYSEFLIWFAIVSVLHFLVYELLAQTTVHFVLGDGPQSEPIIAIMVVCLKVLSFPLGLLLNSTQTEQLPVWSIYVLQMINSAIWGSVIGLVVSFLKRRSAFD
jgi:hypothetical protein